MKKGGYTGKQLSSFKFPEDQFWMNYHIELEEYPKEHFKYLSLDLKEILRSGSRNFMVVCILVDCFGIQYGVWLMEQTDEPAIPIYRTCKEMQDAVREKKLKFI